MRDVAERAGVATSTVSRALNGDMGVSESVRRRIVQIADDLDYTVSHEASKLSRGVTATGRVAVVVPHVDAWFYATALGGVAEAMHAADLDLVLYQVGGERDRYRFFRDLPARGKVDGVLLIALPISDDERAQLESMHVPIVMVGATLDGASSVSVDDKAAAVAAVSYLIELGHRRIAFVNAADDDGKKWNAATDREQGYRDALTDAGIDIRERYIEITLNGRTEGGREAATRLLAQNEQPTAIVCFSDEEAIGAMRAARAAGLSIPEDISIIGFDDQPISEVAGLSTVRQPVREFGAIGARMLTALIGGSDARPVMRTLPSSLVIRNSTARSRLSA